MNPMTSNDRLFALVSALCDEAITAAEFEELDQILRDDEQARLLYVRLMDLHFEVGRSSHPGRTDSPEGHRPHAPHDRSTRLAFTSAETSWQHLRQWIARSTCFLKTPLGAGLAIAVALNITLFAVLGYITMPAHHAFQPSTGRSVASRADARLVRSVDCQWERAGSALADGTPLNKGDRLEIRKGLAEIHFRDGAQVILAGPAVLEIRSAREGHLAAGQLGSHASGDAVGFVISTPSIEIIDLGTEFGVIQEEDGTAEVQVLIGQVQVTHTVGSGDSHELSAGEAFRWFVDGRQPQEVMVDATKFVRRLPPGRSVVAAASEQEEEVPQINSPQDLPGLILWLDASAPNSLFQDAKATLPATREGQLVRSWKDLSGAGNHATNPLTENFLPTYASPAAGAVKFDGDDDFLFQPSNLPSGPKTCVVVYQSDEMPPGKIASVFNFKSVDDNHWNEMILANVGSYRPVSFLVDYGAGESVGFDTPLDTRRHVVGFVFRGGEISLPQHYVSAMDGAMVPVVGSGQFRRSQSGVGAIGRRVTETGSMSDAGLSFSGQIAEIVIYDRDLTPATLKGLVRHLRDKPRTSAAERSKETSN